MSDEQKSQPRSWLDKLTELFSDDPQNRQDIKEIVQEAAKRSIVDPDTLSVIEGALQVSEMQVRDIMIPRSQMITVSIDDEIDEFLPRIIKSTHSRIPVLASDSESEVVGLLLVKDLLPLALPHAVIPELKDLMRPATFVPESKRLHILLHDFRAKRYHMAIVVDDFGGVAGLVTIEDVLEQIVGDIKDEYDPEDDINNHIRNLQNGSYVVNALTLVEDFNKHFQADFSDDEFDTIGGIVMHYFGRMPETNESISIDDWLFTVIQGNSRKLSLLKVTRQPPLPPRHDER